MLGLRLEHVEVETELQKGDLMTIGCMCNGLSSSDPVATMAMRECDNGLSQIGIPIRQGTVRKLLALIPITFKQGSRSRTRLLRVSTSSVEMNV